MGNPHAIVYMDDLKDLDIEKIGPKFENHIAFPDRINTEFIQILDQHTIKMRVWNVGAVKRCPAERERVRQPSRRCFPAVFRREKLP